MGESSSPSISRHHQQSCRQRKTPRSSPVYRPSLIQYETDTTNGALPGGGPPPETDQPLRCAQEPPTPNAALARGTAWETNRT